MVTAILLPQDCLPTSKGRHKANFSDLLYGSDSMLRERGTFQGLDGHPFYREQLRQKFNTNERVGWSATPRPVSHTGQAKVFANTYSSQRDADGRKTKTRRGPVEQSVAKFVSKPVTDVPVFTILQRPKDRNVANEVITKFLVKVDEAKPTVCPCDLKLDLKVNETKKSSGTQNELKNGGSPFKKGMIDGLKLQDPKMDVPKIHCPPLIRKVDCSTLKDSKVDRAKHHGVIFGSSKPCVPRRSVCNRFDDLVTAKGLNQMMSSSVSEDRKSIRMARAAENFSCMLAYANQPTRSDKMVEGSFAQQLRRASTDPQIVRHLGLQHRSEVIEIPYSDAKFFHGISRTSSMSCPERWAGPAYSSSPAPSSLPLPKFSVLHQKISSPNRFPLQPSELGSVHALPGVPQGGELDVVSATRSLRRMLKLEPL